MVRAVRGNLDHLAAQPSHQRSVFAHRVNHDDPILRDGEKHIQELTLCGKALILDLCDRRPVAYVLGDSNNNQLVFDTFDQAVTLNPDAKPIFHSDRGYQYTSRAFHHKLEQAGMTQSMSRVAHCTDNGPMEGFWGILKREMYYKKKFHSREELVSAIVEYIDY